MVEVTYQMVLSTLQTAGILVGIFYYVMTLRNQRKNQEISLRNQELTLKAQEQALETRQAQLFMNIYNQGLTNPDFDNVVHRIIHLRWKDWDEYQALFDYTNPETRDNHLAMSTLMNFYVGVGVIVRENLVDIRLISQLMSTNVKGFWEQIEPIVEEGREHWYGPNWVKDIEYLYNELMKYAEEHPEFETLSRDRRNRDEQHAHW